MSVKRWTASIIGFSTNEEVEDIVADPVGPLVLYSDHAAEIAARDATIARMAEALDELVVRPGDAGDGAPGHCPFCRWDGLYVFEHDDDCVAGDSSVASALAWLSARKREAVREGRQWAIDQLQQWASESTDARDRTIYSQLASSLAALKARAAQGEP